MQSLRDPNPPAPHLDTDPCLGGELSVTRKFRYKKKMKADMGPDTFTMNLGLADLFHPRTFAAQVLEELIPGLAKRTQYSRNDWLTAFKQAFVDVSFPGQDENPERWYQGRLDPSSPNYSGMRFASVDAMRQAHGYPPLAEAPESPPNQILPNSHGPTWADRLHYTKEMLGPAIERILTPSPSLDLSPLIPPVRCLIDATHSVRTQGVPCPSCGFTN